MAKATTILTGLASLTMMLTVIQFEKATGLHSNWESNRALVEQRVRLIQTNNHLNPPVLHERAYKQNLVEIQNYSDQYKCAAKIDTKVCRTQMQW